jgi:uncharacterized membrane protein YfcA
MTARKRFVGGLLSGLVAGASAGLFGVGGGLLLVPLLTSFFGMVQHRAHGTSVAVIGATALAALVVYGSHSNVAWSTAAVVAVGSLISAPLGARWTTKVSPRGLRLAFSVFIALVGIRLLWSVPPVMSEPLLHGWTGAAVGLLLGLVVGVMAGFLGVGGGLISVPAFTLLFGMTQQMAQGTSLAVIMVTGPAAAIEHHRHGNVAWAMVPILALGSMLGAPLASWAAQGLPHAALVRTFAVFLLANAVYTWIRAARKQKDAPTASATSSTASS